LRESTVHLRSILSPLALVCVTAVIVSVTLGQVARNSSYHWFDPIIDVRTMLLNDHVAPPDETALQEAMLAAMMAATGDPYSAYIPPQNTADLDRELRGTYSGIGAEISLRDGRLTIVTPLDDSPALEAGLIGGDIILSIDGEATDGQSIEQSVRRLLGEAGTSVTLRVRHADGVEQEVVIVRRRIVTRTVRGLSRDGDRWDHWLDRDAGIAYIRVGQFIDGTTAEVARTLRTLREEGLAALVLDLRFNGGGALGEAIAMSDLFLDGGTIVSVRQRSGDGRSWNATSGTTALGKDFPEIALLVLVNSASASASEIVAGALQENERAVVLGTRTFGKGSVQEVRPLSRGQGTVKLTTASYHLPSGRNIDRAIAEAKSEDRDKWGVDPDPGFHVPLTMAEQRLLFERRRQWEVIGQGDRDVDVEAPRWSDEAWLAETLADPQLASALRAMRERILGGAWIAVGGEGGLEAARDDEIALLNERRERLASELAALDERLVELRTE